MNIFKEGDWKCEYCSNINFAWRTKCNICKRSKSLSRDSKEKKYEQRSYREGSHLEAPLGNRSRDDPRSKRRRDRRSRSLSESSLFSSKSLDNRKKRSHSRDFSPKGDMTFSNEARGRGRSSSDLKNNDNNEGNNSRVQVNHSIDRNDRRNSSSSGRSDSIHKMRFSNNEN